MSSSSRDPPLSAHSGSVSSGSQSGHRSHYPSSGPRNPREIRSVPAWVRSYEIDDEDEDNHRMVDPSFRNDRIVQPSHPPTSLLPSAIPPPTSTTPIAVISSSDPPSTQSQSIQSSAHPPIIPHHDSTDEESPPTGSLQIPQSALAPHHNNTPSDLQRRVSLDGYVHIEPISPQIPTRFLSIRNRNKQGRKWDSRRSAEPVIISSAATTAAHVARPNAATSTASGNPKIASTVGRRPTANTKAHPAHRRPSTSDPDQGQPHQRVHSSWATSSSSAWNATPHAATWNEFLASSMYSRPIHEKSEVVDYDYLNQLQPGFNEKTSAYANGGRGSDVSRRKRTKALYKRVWFYIMERSLSPLLFRLIVLTSSIVALAVAARIVTVGREISGTTRATQSQAILTMVVDTLAIPYIGYMLWDEYTGKPLGLRSPFEKISLILFDLFFIIFKSASTALAFEYLDVHVDDPIQANGKEDLRTRQLLQLTKALTSFVLIGLVAWTLTFVVNIFRTVDRLSERSYDDDDDDADA